MKSIGHALRRGLKYAAAPLLLLVVAGVGLQGCNRGPWHGQDGPEYLEQRMDRMQSYIGDELNLRPEQQAGFDALMQEYRAVAGQWHTSMRATHQFVRSEAEKEQMDARAIGESLKAALRQRPDDATLEALIDKTVVFYETLDAEQQAEVREFLQHRGSGGHFGRGGYGGHWGWRS